MDPEIKWSSKKYFYSFPVLSSIDEESSKEAGDQLVIPVSVRSALWKTDFDSKSEFSVEVSSKKTRQTVRLPIRLTLDPKCHESVDPSWTSLIGFLIFHYESVVVAVICVFVTWIYAVRTSKSSSSTPPSATNGGIINIGCQYLSRNAIGCFASEKLYYCMVKNAAGLHPGPVTPSTAYRVPLNGKFWRYG